MKKIITFLLIFSLFYINIYAQENENIESKKYTYYYGDGCSHCANLDRYLKQNNAYQKLNIEKKEVYFNEKNRAMMIEEGKNLGLKEDQIGVPFLIIENQENKSYLIGDRKIIDYFIPSLGEEKQDYKKLFFIITIIVLLSLPFFFLGRQKK